MPLHQCWMTIRSWYLAKDNAEVPAILLSHFLSRPLNKDDEEQFIRKMNLKNLLYLCLETAD